MLKIQRYLLIFGLITIIYNLICIFNQKLSIKNGTTIIFEGLLGILCLFLPNLLMKLLKIYFPSTLKFIYFLFIFISVFLGTCLHFISKISHYDKLLHVTSPILFTLIGYGLLASFLPKNKQPLSPWLFLIFGMAFAEMCGVFWEFWEFGCDQLLGMNLQRFALSEGIPLIGRQALIDTMDDLFANTLGAMLTLLYAFFKSKNNQKFFFHFKISIK